MLRTIIIDDEPHAREKLALMLERYCTEVQVVATAKDGSEGLHAIAEHQPDLVFLDIEMPQMTGFDMLRQVPKINFEVIFATAHDHYAIKAIKFSALDYLLKPIDLDQLREAIERAQQRRAAPHALAQYESLQENLGKSAADIKRIAIPSQNGMLFVRTDEVVRCEADSNYTILYLANKQKLVSTRSLKEYENLLADDGFLRIHHSYLINRAHLVRYIKGEGGQVVMDDGTTWDVSRRKKDEFLGKLK